MDRVESFLAPSAPENTPKHAMRMEDDPRCLSMQNKLKWCKMRFKFKFKGFSFGSSSKGFSLKRFKSLAGLVLYFDKLKAFLLILA